MDTQGWWEAQSTKAPRPTKDSHLKLWYTWRMKASVSPYLGAPYLGSVVLNPGQFIGSQGAFQRALRDHFFPLQDET